MRIFTTFILLFVLLTSSCAQSSNSEKEPIIQMDELMFLTRVFDYKNDTTEWKYKGDKPAVIDFYATWCAPCRMIAPTLKDLAKEYQDSIYVYKVDVDKERGLSSAMGIQSMPTILFVPMQGQPQVIVGAADKKTFRRAIEEVLLGK